MGKGDGKGEGKGDGAGAGAGAGSGEGAGAGAGAGAGGKGGFGHSSFGHHGIGHHGIGHHSTFGHHHHTTYGRPYRSAIYTRPNGFRYRTVGVRRVRIVSRPVYGRMYIASSGAAPVQLASCQNNKRQDGWKWCNKCQNMTYAGLGTGVCVTGGGHDHTGSGSYHIPLAANADCNTQPKWKWCCKCQVLFYEGGATSSCPATDQKHDSTGSGDYYLCLANKHGQTDWNWCNKCSSMFYGPFRAESKCNVGKQMGQAPAPLSPTSGGMNPMLAPLPVVVPVGATGQPVQMSAAGVVMAPQPVVMQPVQMQPMQPMQPMGAAPAVVVVQQPQPMVMQPMQPMGTGAAAPSVVMVQQPQPVAGTNPMLMPVAPMQPVAMAPVTGADGSIQMMPMGASAGTAAAPPPLVIDPNAQPMTPQMICQPHDPTGGGVYSIWHDAVQPVMQDVEEDDGPADDDCCCVIL